MKPLPRSILPALFATLLAGCSTPSTPPPLLQKRLAPEWIASTRRIESGGRTIYYRGKARGAATTGAVGWTGTVTGEILALDPGMAIVIPAGTVTLASTGEMKVAGEQHVITSDSPAWKHLLRP